MPNCQNVTSPIFLIGPGRSGTSWVLATLSKHPDVQSLIEHNFIHMFYKEVFASWWSQSYIELESNEQERERRAATALQVLMSEIFPGEQPHWVMKILWSDLPWDFLCKAFPKAKYIHLVRNPTTALPSIMEYLNHLPWANNLKSAERAYLDTHYHCLSLRDTNAPYLMIHQEEIQANPASVWQRIQEFSGLRKVFLPLETLDQEHAVANSMRGKVKSGRAPIQWQELSQETFELCRQFGYQPPIDTQPMAGSPQYARLELDGYIRQIETAQAQIKQLETEKYSFEFQCQTLMETAQQTRAELERSQTERQQTRAELERSQTERQQMLVELERSQSMIKAMESSKFWKTRKAWFSLKRLVGLDNNK